MCVCVCEASDRFPCRRPGRLRSRLASEGQCEEEIIGDPGTQSARTRPRQYSHHMPFGAMLSQLGRVANKKMRESTLGARLWLGDYDGCVIDFLQIYNH